MEGSSDACLTWKHCRWLAGCAPSCHCEWVAGQCCRWMIWQCCTWVPWGDTYVPCCHCELVAGWCWWVAEDGCKQVARWHCRWVDGDAELVARQVGVVA